MNPFVKNTPIEVIEVTENWDLSMTIPASNADSKVETRIPRKYYVNKHKSVSLFRVKGLSEAIYSLGNSARGIMFYILLNASDKDTIVLDYKSIMTELDITANTYYNALNELINAGIIAKKYSKEYWINPWYFYSADRISKMKELYGDEALNVVSKVSKKR